MDFMAYYTSEQMEEIVELISENYGGDGYIAHETGINFVHTDVYISEDEERRSLVTFGMGAAAMKAPIERFERIELVMHSSLDTDITSEKGCELLNFIVGMTKYPFRNNTWFGPGHTVDVPKGFADAFGYEFILLVPTTLVFSPSDRTNGVSEVYFLNIVPIYEDEREWIVENNSFVYMALLYNKFGEDMFKADLKREHYIPSDEDLLLLEEDNDEN